MVCVSIEVSYFESGRTITPEIYHISDVKVNGASHRPTYKRNGDEYIFYFPDAYGWRIGELINGTKRHGFTFASNS